MYDALKEKASSITEQNLQFRMKQLKDINEFLDDIRSVIDSADGLDAQALHAMLQGIKGPVVDVGLFPEWAEVCAQVIGRTPAVNQRPELVDE